MSKEQDIFKKKEIISKKSAITILLKNILYKTITN